MSDLFTETGATFSVCRQFRYRLWRLWDRSKKPLLFVGLNPSTADEIDNDATIERMQRRSVAWGYGGLLVGNLFAWRETKSKLMVRRALCSIDVIGPENDFHLIEMAKQAGIILCGWGPKGALGARGSEVLGMLNAISPVHALKVTKGGHPQHPLYMAYALTPQPMLPKQEMP